MSWLTDRWGQGGPFGAATKAVDRNRGPIGDVFKYGSDIVAPFTGPFAPLVAGAGNAIGTAIQPGTNFGDIAKSGVIGAGLGYAGQQLRGAFGAGSAAGSAAGSGASTGLGDLGSGAASAGTSAADAGASSLGSGPSSLGSQVWNAVKGVGSWAGKNSNLVGMGLKAVGDAPVNEAMARRLAILNQQAEYELDRQRARDQAVSPLWQALAGQAQRYGAQPTTVAPNPYAR